MKGPVEKRGFVLVELLVILALLAGLAVLALPNLSTQDDARRAVDLLNVRAINASLQLYRARNNGSCPPDERAFRDFLRDSTFFPDGPPIDPWTDPASSRPYERTYSSALCRVQVSISTPPRTNHATGRGH